MSPRRSRRSSSPFSGLIALTELVLIVLRPFAKMQATQRKIDEENLRIHQANLRIEEKEQRRLEKQLLLKNKEDKQLYLEDRMREVESLNRSLLKEISDLKNILQHSLDNNFVISFERLMRFFQNFIFLLNLKMNLFS